MAETGVRVLIVDDDLYVRESISAYLEDHDYIVETAQDGYTGQQKLDVFKPDFVFVDLRMPGLDGFEVTTYIHERAPDIPVIVISGTGEVHEAMEAIRAGAWDFISKPILDMNLILYTLDQLGEKARLKADNVAYRTQLEQLVSRRTEELQSANNQLRAEIKNREITQDKLRELNENLEIIVQERTRDLRSINARLSNSLNVLKEDEKAGRQIQLSLIPPASCAIRDYQFQRLYMPAMYVSGDFIGFFEINENNIGFYMADVAGHGVPSAFVTVLLHSLMNNMRTRLGKQDDETILSPSESLLEINAELIRGRYNRHIAMFYGILKPKESKLIYCNAGQYPFPILSHANTATHISSKGLPLGMLQSPPYVTLEQELPPKFALSIFSDGVLDALGENSLSEKNDLLCRLSARDDMNPDDLIVELSLGEKEQLRDDVSIVRIMKE
ncbi:MAG: response regulator [Spartobacteria bacterium]|nr:response regulator [Spartobacteria bacterium]